MKWLKNVELYAPAPMGTGDVLVAGERVVAIRLSGDPEWGLVNVPGLEVVDGQGARLTPGLIDQHIHITGAGGKY